MENTCRPFIVVAIYISMLHVYSYPTSKYCKNCQRPVSQPWLSSLWSPCCSHFYVYRMHSITMLEGHATTKIIKVEVIVTGVSMLWKWSVVFIICNCDLTDDRDPLILAIGQLARTIWHCTDVARTKAWATHIHSCTCTFTYILPFYICMALHICKCCHWPSFSVHGAGDPPVYIRTLKWAKGLFKQAT